MEAGNRPFPFSRLPVEAQLMVLENTALVTPERRVAWDPTRKFRFPRTTKKSRPGSPAALFLVSKDMYAKATQVFWKNNTVEIQTFMDPFYALVQPGEPLHMPRRYASSYFFDGGISVDSFPFLRNLEFFLFGTVGWDVVEKAQGDWLRTLNKVQTCGGLQLESISISTNWHSDKTGEMACRAATGEDLITAARDFIHKHVWPLHGQHGPPIHTQQLFVRMEERATKAIYSIRRNDAKIPDGTQRRDLGIPHATRSFIWQHESAKQEAGDATFSSYNWTEEAWLMI